jgi:hypothetical protein
MKASVYIAGPIGIVVFISLIFAVSAVDAATVKVDPASQTVAAGDAFHVTVTVEDVTNMKADQAVLNFDPSVMHVTGVAEGDFLKTGGSTIGLGTWDNTAGTATFGYSLTGDPGTWTPVGGGGTLATIEFEIYPDAPAGIYDLRLTDVVLIDAKHDEISTGISNDVVTILSPTTATPTQTRTSTHDGGGNGVVVFDATEESTTDMNITDTISPTPVATTPDTVTNISANATTDTPIVQTPASTPSSVPGLSGIDAIAAIGLLAILFAIKKRKWK